jgi:hypothetical protein
VPLDARAQIQPLVDEVKAGTRPSSVGPYYQTGDYYLMETRLLAAIERLSPPGSVYRDAAERRRSSVNELASVAQGLLEDIEAGYHQTVAEVIHADVFADFLDMASELQTKRYKDAAAVIAGSSLEEHLRKLAEKHKVDTVKSDGQPKKATVLNDNLVKAEAYTRLEARQVDAWQAIRNAAAHGEYEEYDHQQVAALISGVRDFMVKHPA